MTIDELEELRYLNSEIQAVQREIEVMYNTYRSPAFEKIKKNIEESKGKSGFTVKGDEENG